MDLTVPTTRVFTVSNVGTYVAGDNGQTVTFTGGGTGTLVAISTVNMQALIRSCAGTINSGAVTLSGGHTFTVSNTGDQARAIAKIDGVWVNPDTTAVYISAYWKTDADHYVKIYTTDTARHSGKWDSTKYVLQVTAAGSYVYAMRIYTPYVRVDGLQVYMTGAAGLEGYGVLENSSVNGDVRISNCIIKSTLAAGGSQAGIRAIFGVKIYNNIVYGFEDYGINLGGNWTVSSVTSYLYNNTSINCGTGFVRGGG
ncbi:MAG: hypothetical protein ACD_79C01360G0001, partial [uncultured bacterium]